MPPQPENITDETEVETETDEMETSGTYEEDGYGGHVCQQRQC